MDGEFLQLWLTEAHKSQQLFDEQKFSRIAMNEQAIAHGYRTGTIWLQAMQDQKSALSHFVNAQAFKELWAILKKHDEIYGDDWAYSARIAGVPNRLLQAIDGWHKLPKLTKAERVAHSKKIAKACVQLEDLIGQVIPGHAFESPYSRFIFSGDGQAEAVFRVFGSEPTNSHGIVFEVGHRLRLCGVTPLWAVEKIREMAEGDIRENVPLTKIRALTAKKSFLIDAVSREIDRACVSELPKKLGLTHRLIADVVGLLAGMDCEVEDVRKRLTALEDSS